MILQFVFTVLEHQIAVRTVASAGCEIGAEFKSLR